MKEKRKRQSRKLVSIGRRLKSVRDQLGVSQSEITERLGVTQSSLARYESGQRRVPLPVLLALEHEFRVNHEWVLTGKGEPLRGVPPPGAIVLVSEKERKAFEELEGSDKYHAVPYMRDPAAAGAGLVMEEDIAGYCIIHDRVAPRPDEIRCVRIFGESMAPTLTDGSIVAVNITIRDLHLVKGRIVCARTGEGEVVIKRLRLRERHVLLHSDNPDQEKYPPLVVDLREQPEPVIGQVVWAWVDLR